MLKRTLLSFLAGSFLAVMLVAAPRVQAACQGYCADQMVKNGCHFTYDGCDMQYDADGNLMNVTCYYVGMDGCLPD